MIHKQRSPLFTLRQSRSPARSKAPSGRHGSLGRADAGRGASPEGHGGVQVRGQREQHAEHHRVAHHSDDWRAGRPLPPHRGHRTPRRRPLWRMASSSHTPACAHSIIAPALSMDVTQISMSIVLIFIDRLFLVSHHNHNHQIEIKLSPILDPNIPKKTAIMYKNYALTKLVVKWKQSPCEEARSATVSCERSPDPTAFLWTVSRPLPLLASMVYATINGIRMRQSYFTMPTPRPNPLQ